MQSFQLNLCHRNEFYNSKAGREEDGEAAAEATGGGSVRG